MRNIRIMFVLPLMITICVLMGGVYFFFEEFFLVFFPFCIIFLISFPLIIRDKADFFSIWSWILYSSILGVLFRSLYIYYDIPDYGAIDSVFLYGKPKSFLLPAMLLVFFGIFFLVVGYIVPNKALKLKFKIVDFSFWNERKFFSVVFLLMIVSLVALLLFINAQGGLFSLESISSYRGVSDTLAEASPHSYLRLLVSFSGINLFLLTAWWIRYPKLKFLTGFLWLVSFVTYIFFNFYVSQRGAIVFSLIQLTALSYYIKGFNLPKFKLVLGIVFALIIFQAMSILRGVKDVDNKDIKISVIKALEPAILTTNMIDISKTAHIIDAIPEKLNYEYGATLTTIFIAWIPREFWPNKPVTNVDNTIGIKVFGASTYGSGAVPPGFIAELYWNFWIPGVLIGCFLLGGLLKLINQTILRSIANPNVAIIYVVNFMFIGLSFVGSSFSSVLIGVLQTLIPLVIVINFITERKN